VNVYPMNSGMTVERRDHVLMGRRSSTLCESTFFRRLASTKGPFLIDLGKARPPLSRYFFFRRATM